MTSSKRIVHCPTCLQVEEIEDIAPRSSFTEFTFHSESVKFTCNKCGAISKEQLYPNEKSKNAYLIPTG